MVIHHLLSGMILQVGAHLVNHDPLDQIYWESPTGGFAILHFAILLGMASTALCFKKKQINQQMERHNYHKGNGKIIRFLS